MRNVCIGSSCLTTAGGQPSKPGEQSPGERGGAHESPCVAMPMRTIGHACLAPAQGWGGCLKRPEVRTTQGRECTARVAVSGRMTHAALFAFIGMPHVKNDMPRPCRTRHVMTPLLLEMDRAPNRCVQKRKFNQPITKVESP